MGVSPPLLTLEGTLGNVIAWRSMLSFQDGKPPSEYRNGDTAARCGHVELLRQRGIKAFTFTTFAMDGAAYFGHLRTAQWLDQHQCVACCSVNAMYFAAQRGDLDMLSFLHLSRREGCTSAAMDAAAEAGRLPSVQWLHTHRTEGCSTAAMDGASAKGHLPVLKWLNENRSEGGTFRAMDGAAAGGHLQVVQWLHEAGATCSQAAADMAAKAGHFKVLEWLLKNRSEGFTALALKLAAANGHLSVLKLLVGASKGSSTPASIYASRQTVWFNKDTLVTAAAGGGHLGTLEWLGTLQEQGPHKGGTSKSTATFTPPEVSVISAAEGGHLAAVEWLHKHGAVLPEGAMDKAASGGHLDTLTWLHLHGCTCSKAAMDGAAAGGHAETVRWLHRFRKEGCTRRAVTMASWNGHKELSQWVKDNANIADTQTRS